MKYLMINNVKKFVDDYVTENYVDGSVNSETDYLTVLENKITEIIEPVLKQNTKEKYMLVLPEAIFLNRMKNSQGLFSESTFQWFADDKTPFHILTEKYANLIIVAGTICWQYREGHGYFNTCVVFEHGRNVLIWDKQSFADVDLPDKLCQLFNEYVTERCEYWNIDHDQNNQYIPNFSDPYLNKYCDYEKPRFIFDGKVSA